MLYFLSLPQVTHDLAGSVLLAVSGTTGLDPVVVLVVVPARFLAA
jgi:hypothetical protein